MESNWTFVRTLQFELGLDLVLAERVEQLVADSPHFHTQAQVEEEWAKMDQTEAKLEAVIERQDEEIHMLLRHIEGP